MRNFLKRFISRETADKVRAKVAQIDESIIPFFAKSRLTSSLYYAFFSREFAREHQSVLKGRLAYKKSLNDITQSSVLLRRNTHRLEKGLIMKPRKDVFALGYIEETVDCYIKCVKAQSICQQELKWATDVLESYFKAITLDTLTTALSNQFEQHKISSKVNADSDFVPYMERERLSSSIDVDTLHDLFKRRRSVRWYKDELVPKSTINKALTLASLAPSACNRQPFEFYYLTGQDAVAIAKLAMGTAGFATNIPSLLVVVGDLSSYPAERDKHVIYIDAALASMQLMLAFESMGVSSCPINWPDVEFREKQMASQLKLKAYQRPVMLISFGYADPDGSIPFSQKKLPEQLLKEVNL